MNVLAILRDAWFFYSRHFLTIVRLCLPLILLGLFWYVSRVSRGVPGATTGPATG